MLPWQKRVREFAWFPCIAIPHLMSRSTFLVHKCMSASSKSFSITPTKQIIHFLLSSKSFVLHIFCVCFQKGNIRYINRSELHLRYTHKFAVRAKAFLFTHVKYISWSAGFFYFCIHNCFGCSERHFGYTKRSWIVSRYF